MSKIVQAVNSMIGKSKKISQVFYIDGNEIFFVYDDKYKWSIKEENDENYSLHFYLSEEKIEEIANTSDLLPPDAYITYRTDELKTREAKESFRDLYILVKEKLLGADQALDDIIFGDLPF